MSGPHTIARQTEQYPPSIPGGGPQPVNKDAIPKRIKNVARDVGFALIHQDADAWHAVTQSFGRNLEDEERAALAWSVLRSLTPVQVDLVCQAITPDGAGPPMTPLFSFADEAAFWADIACSDELDAYCLASFNRMTTSRQAEFLNFVQRRAAA